MFFRTALAAMVMTATVASSALARPVYDQLQSANSAVSSQNRAFGFSTRAADDFRLPPGNNKKHNVTRIEVIMIGNGAATNGKFAVRIFQNDPTIFGNRPGFTIATRTSASSVATLGATGPVATFKYRVTFNIPSGTIRLDPNTKYWISAYSNNDDSKTWGFAKSSTEINEDWGCHSFGYPAGGWGVLLPATDFAFRITTTQ